MVVAMSATAVLARGQQTRERILEAAERAVLQKGFKSTSIEEVVVAAGITRNGFFYHFPDKHALAKALLVRYIEHDDALIGGLLDRADELVDDPLQAYLAFLKMFSEVMADLPDRHPGCLVASYCYQDQVFSREIRSLSAETMIRWRNHFRARLDMIARHYAPSLPVDLDALADMVLVLVEGGIIMDKVHRGKGVLPRQLLLARTFIGLLFGRARQ